MKKFFFVAAIALVSLFCFSANAETTGTAPAEKYASSVTANISGIMEGVDFETGKLVLVYNLMPQKYRTSVWRHTRIFFGTPRIGRKSQ